MTLDVDARTEWTTTGAAYCGAVLGAVAVIAHELYIVLFSNYPIADPFLHVMIEMAVVVPGGGGWGVGGEGGDHRPHSGGGGSAGV